ncbi:MAG TPA: TetR/AcrR family transcriptional regulator [Pseudorhodoplanes sp.]|nr:TetR/AcrR family transcriptional regulator [Pseudorhodoplanes sp.]
MAHRRTRREKGAAGPRSGKAAATARDRAARSAARREAILAAALEEFAVGGFAATRLDDIARRAGVAKGTIYLYFRDKEALFQELLRSMFSPLVDALSAMPAEDLPAREVAERMIAIFIREVLGTRRKDVIRLVIAEGKRFPKLAEFHFREVIGRVMPVVSALLTRAAQRGEIDSRLPQFPQLLAAPGVVAIVWQALFDRLAPLDVEAMMRVHLDLLFGPRAS